MAAGKNVAAQQLAQGGNWLFRQGELVLGPIPAGIIVEKLYSGELDGRTEVTPMGNSQFKRLAEVDFFKVHLAKAEAKLRVDKLANQQQKKSVRTRNTKVGMVAAVCAVVAVVAGTAAWYLAIHKPWADADELAFGDITVEPPTITLASRTSNEELVDYPSDGDKTGRRVSERIADKTRTPSETRTDPKRTERPTARSGKVGDEKAEPDGMKTEQFDRSAINAVVAARQRSLYPCLVEEAKKHPGLVAKIPIEFVVGNEGRVNKIWVDNPDFKSGALPECLLGELKKWPFKAYAGEQATVGLSFKIGKGG